MLSRTGQREDGAPTLLVALPLRLRPWPLLVRPRPCPLLVRLRPCPLALRLVVAMSRALLCVLPLGRWL